MAKGPKWIGLKGKYDRPPIEQGYREKQDEFLNTPLEDEGLAPSQLDDFGVAKLYFKVKLAKEAAESVARRYEMQKDALARLMAERFEEDDKTSTSFTNGGSMRITPDVYPVVKNPGQLLAWVKANGMESVLTLNYQTMQSMVKQRLLEGKPIPDGVDVFLKDKLTITGFNEKPTES
jgi:hypothetical protein